MQSAIDDGYLTIARDEASAIAGRCHADLPDDEAARPQEIAARTALGDLARWG